MMIKIYFTKTESINSEIDEALQKAPSKSGGDGSNYPDIKLFLQTSKGRKITEQLKMTSCQSLHRLTIFA